MEPPPPQSFERPERPDHEIRLESRRPTIQADLEPGRGQAIHDLLPCRIDFPGVRRAEMCPGSSGYPRYKSGTVVR